ncbi:putative nucleotidyltransferase [Bosea robiniae]|uniref:hypothetical protein n=1 Tax=Bosea TaxID=85413 RepID=UPI00285AE7B9|nr:MULTISPECIES: hypothetical protein [Bosea]MDR6831010.1 putative nucleotidyltransferase [Bosea robiniae]MDR6897385.1 putative nucleotidyltransferase [Bosea sp. BE109]MDR7140782.1 putative nucleotidyltransferase [Bosea sp. BE168]
MDLPEKVAGVDPLKMRDLFVAFLDSEPGYQKVYGLRVPLPRHMTVEFIGHELAVSQVDAIQIQKRLISEGWLVAEKLSPTSKGMALSQYTDRPKIARAEAKKILASVLAWAADTNKVANARVKVKAIDLFGSVQRGEPFVGDVDIFVEFTTMDLGADLEPRDMAREAELLQQLSQISEYVSPSSAFDRELMSNVPRERVFP